MGPASALPPLPASTSTKTVKCETDGSEGKRIAVAYLTPDGQRNGFKRHVQDIGRTLHKMDAVWDSAADPYDQHPRWLCNPHGSTPRIIQLQGPAIGSDNAYTFAEIVAAMKRAGYNSPDRIYLIFVDHIHAVYSYGGQATTDDDDSPGRTNLNNVGPAYAMIDGVGKKWHWSSMWYGALHELGHAMGAVQCSAPHSSCPGGETGHHHCWDEYDVMCYADGGSFYTGNDRVSGSSDDRQVHVVCDAGSPAADQWDCGKDDYFNTSAVSGSYLATHWNLARSAFVTRLGPE